MALRVALKVENIYGFKSCLYFEFFRFFVICYLKEK